MLQHTLGFDSTSGDIFEVILGDNIIDNFFDDFDDTFDAASNNTFNIIDDAVFDNISGDTSDDIDITESTAPGKDLLGLIYIININVIKTPSCNGIRRLKAAYWKSVRAV